MSAVPILASVLLAIAAAGMLRPLLRGRAVALEFADPAEEKRLMSLRALKELARDRTAGLVNDEEYVALRGRLEREAITVLRNLSPGARVPGAPSLAVSPNGNARPQSASRARRVSAVLLVTAFAAASLPLLIVSVRQRSVVPGGVTQDAGSGQSDPLSFFEQRVQQHPNDVAARLDLAERLLNTKGFAQATDQYLAVLKLDPANAEARAKLGFLLFLSGAPDQARKAEDAALRADPTYPEALYFKGLILLRGLHRATQAADALRAYLANAPFGSYRSQAQDLLVSAGAGVGS